MAAHTSPIYVAVGDRDRPPISPADRDYLATLLEGGMTWVDELATPLDEHQQRRIRATFEAAAEKLQIAVAKLGDELDDGSSQPVSSLDLVTTSTVVATST